MEIIHPGHRRRGRPLRRGIAGFVGASLVLLGCVREPGPEEVALQYGRALYASDLARAYRFISSEDQRVKDEATFHRERGQPSGFALELARKLATFIEAMAVQKTVRGKGATVRLRLRLPDANAREIVALVGEWDERRLNALSRREREKIKSELDRLHRAAKIPMLEGDETFELVREASGWRVALNWAGGVRVRFQAAIRDRLPLRVTVVPEETRLTPGERVRVTVLSHSLPGSLDHLGREIYPDYSPLRSNFVGSEDDVYPAPATEINHHLAGLQICECGRVPAPPGEVEGHFWHSGQVSFSVESLIHRVARTGLPLAGSAGLLTAAGLGELSISARYQGFDLLLRHPRLLCAFAPGSQ